MTPKRRPLTITAVLTVTALIAACGSDDAETGESADTADTSSTADDAALTTQYPLTIDNCGTEIVIDAAPQNAVVVDTSLAETLVALGVVDRIAATYFDFENGGIDPANRTALDTLTVLGDGGYPSREAVVSIGPDLVFAFGDSDFEQEGAPTRTDLEGTPIYRSEAFGCAEGVGVIEDSFEEILELGMIFDRQAEAQAIVDEQQARLAAVEQAVADLEKPKVIYWDAYDVENIRLLPFGYFQDAATRAGAEVLFADVSDNSPVSREQIATSDVEVVLAVDYGLETTTPLLPLMQELVSATPAGKRGEDGVLAITNYPPNLQAVSLVEAIAKALHPEIEIG